MRNENLSEGFILSGKKSRNDASSFFSFVYITGQYTIINISVKSEGNAQG